jgi:hypothetical protein
MTDLPHHTDAGAVDSSAASASTAALTSHVQAAASDRPRDRRCYTASFLASNGHTAVQRRVAAAAIKS